MPGMGGMPGGMGGMPGGMGGMPGGMGAGGMPDLSGLLSDPDIIEAFKVRKFASPNSFFNLIIFRFTFFHTNLQNFTFIPE